MRDPERTRCQRFGLAEDGAGEHAGAREAFQPFLAFEQHADHDARIDDARSRIK